jgi:hypothetical protein
VIVRSFVAAAILAAAPVVPQAQSASAPLIVTATVVSTCRIAAARLVEPSGVATLPVALTCTRSGAAARVQRPIAPRRSEMRDAVLMIDF